MTEARVRDALAGIGAEVDAAPDLLERTRRRVVSRRRQRATRTALAAAACLAVVVGTVAAVARDDDRAPVTAGQPAAPVPEEIVAVVDGAVVVLSSQDGSVLRTLVDAPGNGFETEITVAGEDLLYTRPGEPLPGCSDDRRDLVGPGGRILTSSGPLQPIGSPDGMYVAYRMSECDSPAGIGMTSLADGRNYRSEGSVPLAWELDGAGLLAAVDGELAILSVPVADAQRVLELPGGVYRATFVSEDEVAVAYPDGDEHVVALATLDGAVDRELARAPSNVSSLSFDEPSRTLLVGGDGALRYVPLDGERPSTLKLPGVTAGAWLRDSVGTAPETPPDPVTVVLPDVVGLDADEAVTVLEDLGFDVALEETGAGRVVVEMSSAPGTPVPAGSTITLVVGALERVPVTVPDLDGLSAVDAERALSQAGLSSTLVGTAAVDDPGANTVFWQEPPPGTRRMTGDTVTIWVCGPGADCVAPPGDFVDDWELATRWEPIDLAQEPWASVAAESYAGPEAIGDALADRFAADFQLYETVSGRYSGELWVQIRGLADDSVDGVDYRLAVEEGADGWRLAGGEVRSICRRGGGETCV